MKIDLGNKRNPGPGWICVDRQSRADVVMDFEDQLRYPFEDNSAEFINCSQVVEHLSDRAVSFLLQESYRILKPGGIIRVGTVDLDYYLMLYKFKKESKFREIKNSKGNPALVGDTIEDLLLNTFICYKTAIPKVKGPPRLRKEFISVENRADFEIIANKALDSSIYLESFLDTCKQAFYKPQPDRVYFHRTAFNVRRLKMYMTNAMFSYGNLLQMNYNQTLFDEGIQVRDLFPERSIYVEAVK